MFGKSKTWLEKERDTEERLEEAKRRKALYEKESEIRDIKKSMRWNPQTTKVITVYLFILLNVIVIYTLVASWYFADLTYIGVLISDIAAQVAVFLVYAVKSYSETREEEKIKLERDKLSIGSETEEPEPDESAEENLELIMSLSEESECE